MASVCPSATAREESAFPTEGTRHSQPNTSNRRDLRMVRASSALATRMAPLLPHPHALVQLCHSRLPRVKRQP